MKTLFSVLLVVLVIACGKPRSRCEDNAGCFEGGKCVAGACAYACEEVGCLDGHFCNPDSHYCKDYCPHACPDRPANATLICGEVCVYACNDGFRECAGRAGACLSDSSDPTACGPSCESLQICPVPENGAAACSDGVCGYACNSGFNLCGDRCASDTDATACGPNCVQCTTTDPNAESTCESNACVSKCKTGSRPSGTGCVACPGSDCSAIQPVTTTTYNNTELTWQACAAGYIGNDCQTEIGTAKTMDWEAAKKYCDDSTWHGYKGWRLPTQPSQERAAGELGSIMATCPSPVTQGSACIDNNAFPNTPADFFWSSDAAGYPYNVWGVVFGRPGYVSSNDKRKAYYVRCVHDP
jgi:hypothetical protein